LFDANGQLLKLLDDAVLPDERFLAQHRSILASKS
jgi:hypothetical protein